MPQHYYYIRLLDDDGKVLTIRCEQASGPRDACRKAFGVVYDKPTDTARYLDIGTKSPRYLSQKRKRELQDDPNNWHPIPRSTLTGPNVEPKQAKCLGWVSKFDRAQGATISERCRLPKGHAGPCQTLSMISAQDVPKDEELPTGLVRLKRGSVLQLSVGDQFDIRLPDGSVVEAEMTSNCLALTKTSGPKPAVSPHTGKPGTVTTTQGAFFHMEEKR